MSNPVAICNSALITLGANQITSLTDTSIEGKACNAKFDIARRELLRNHVWNFAIKRVQLAPSVTAPVYQYEYRFPLPSDCLRVLTVYQVYNHRIEGRNIVTSEVSDPASPLAELKYISDIEDPSLWDAGFVNVMVNRMALELAYTLPGKNTMIDQMAALYDMYLQAAKATDASEDVEDPLDPFTSPLIATRFTV